MPKVLIVDDDENSRAVLIDALGDEGYVMVEAANGEDALQTVAKDPPDLVLLDIMMPGIDGVEVCHTLKKDDNTRHIPIVMVTALGDEQDMLRGLKVGATDYLGKPFSGTVVRARVRAALRSKLAHDEVKQLAAQISDKNRKLTQFAETAHRFVDDVSHDFRTPLTVIREFASIIADGLDGPVTQQQKEHLAVVLSAVDDLARMVDDLLDSSKLRIGALRVDRRPHHIQQIMKSVVPVIVAKARTKDIRIVETVAADLPMVFADKEKVGRIILNLAINAVKFSPRESEIELWAKPLDSGDLEVGVTDHGRGLSEEEVARVFERFAQTGSSTDTKGKGLGLGLSIAKELVSLNLGEIHIESELGRGSTFSFTLPVHEPALILRNYLNRLVEATNQIDRLAVLRLRTTHSEPGAEALRVFAASTCYPMDLILDCGDSVLAVGLTAEPTRWIDRLRSAWIEMVSEAADEKKPEVRVEHIGSWSYRQQTEALLAFLIEQFSRSASYARKGSDH